MNLSETMNRTVKLAMDDGRATSVRDAMALFSAFTLQVVVQPGFSRSKCAQAALLTLINAAPRTFLGGVTVHGDTEERFTLGPVNGATLGEVATVYSATPTPKIFDQSRATIFISEGEVPSSVFSLGVSLRKDGFELHPDGSANWEPTASVSAGVAAAGAALSEAFQWMYFRSPIAGQRNVTFTFPSGEARAPADSNWIIGLGHLGQAYLWTMLLDGGSLPSLIRLSDDDLVTVATLSTSLLANSNDIGRKKVSLAATHLSYLEVRAIEDSTRVSLDAELDGFVPEVTIVTVDNIGFRRSIDKIGSGIVLEAGIGDGVRGFTSAQFHRFPGQRRAMDVWAGDDPRAIRAVDISTPAYQALLSESGDECGTTLVAGRSIATPFVGAFSGAYLHWLATHEVSDCSWAIDLKDI